MTAWGRPGWKTRFPELPRGFNIKTYTHGDGEHLQFYVSDVGQHHSRTFTFYEDDLEQQYQRAAAAYREFRTGDCPATCPLDYNTILKRLDLRR